jgi:hypothetical protein
MGEGIRVSELLDGVSTIETEGSEVVEGIKGDCEGSAIVEGNNSDCDTIEEGEGVDELLGTSFLPSPSEGSFGVAGSLEPDSGSCSGALSSLSASSLLSSTPSSIGSTGTGNGVTTGSGEMSGLGVLSESVPTGSFEPSAGNGCV